MTRRKWILLGVLIIVALATTFCNPMKSPGATKGEPEGKNQTQSAGVAVDQYPTTADIDKARGSFVALAKAAKPAVVNISVTKNMQGGQGPFGLDSNDPYNEFFKHFFGPGVPKHDFKQKGLGSGFVLDPDGTIVTNNHVVDGADKITVKFSDGTELEATIKGSDPKTDVAVIQAKTDHKLAYLSFGDSDKLEVGEWVIAIGNPFGLEHTVTAGIVSAKGRVIGAGPYDDFIQTDASINPGNSGGPLIDMKGEVVGINTLITASGQGIGFAIPSNQAKQIIAQLKTSGVVTRGWLGVLIQPIDKNLAKQFGLDKPKGALVSEVVEGGPAEKAGVKTGDIIMKFKDLEIDESNELPRMVAGTPIGTKSKLTIFRDGKTIEMQVTVGKLPEDRQSISKSTGSEGEQDLGLTISDLRPDQAKSKGLKSGQGVIISNVIPGSKAMEAGLRPGDIITEVNRKTAKDVVTVKNIVSDIPKGSNILLLIKREDGSFFVTIEK